MTCWAKRNLKLNTDAVKNAGKITIVVTDIDGVLTDGRVFFLDGALSRFFNIKDGFAFVLLKLSGIKTAVISGKSSAESRKRLEELGVDYYLEGVEDKLAAMEGIIEKSGIGWENVCYIGDDLPDLPVMEKAGFSAAPSDACVEVRDTADYVCGKEGGKGVFRETAEVILKEKGIWEEILQKFLSS